ncbi:MAG: chromosome segregation protein SMC, partial [candidate division Zixibacteria bacterium RBG_16_40_9]
NKNILPIEYQQVTISRRVYRDGSGEYLLNGIPCRLKDIVDLFSDTGVGALAYSVMEQSMVDSLLSENAQDRRALFEEAAGITKYKHRRKEALRKLEQTENDLLRLHDIISEIEKQVNSLKRQMRKALVFQKTSELLKELELKLAKSEYENIKTREKEISQKLKLSHQDQEVQKVTLDKEELTLENAKLELLEAEKKVESQQKEINQLQELFYQKQQQVLVSQEKQQALNNFLAQLSSEIESLNSQKLNLEKNIKEKKPEFEKLQELLREKEKAVATLEKELASFENQYNHTRQAYESGTEELSTAERNLNSAKTESANINFKIEESQKLKSNLVSEYQKSQKELEEKEDQFLRTFNELEKLKLDWENAQKIKTELQDQLQELEQKLKDNQLQETRLDTSLASERAKHKVLEKFFENYEGYNSGVQHLINQKEKFKILDTVANLIQTDTQYSWAIEAALGERKSFLVVDKLDSAKKALNHLKENQKGEGGFIIKDELVKLTQSVSRIQIKESDGVIGRGSDLVENGKHSDWLTKSLLDRTLVVKDFEIAKKLLRTIPQDHQIVTLEGELLTKEGVVKGGERKEFSLVGKEKELKSLTEKIQTLDSQLKIAINQKAEIIHEIEIAKTELDNISEPEKTKRELWNKKELEMKEVELEKKAIEEGSFGKSQQIVEQDRSLKELAKQKHSLEQNLSQLAEGLQNLTEKVNASKQKVGELEKQKEELNLKLNQSRIEVVSQQGKTEQLTNDLSRVEEMFADTENKFKQRSKDIKAKEKEQTQLVSDIENFKAGLVEVEKQKEQIEQTLDASKEQYHTIHENLLQFEEKLKTSRHTRMSKQELVHQLELQQHDLLSQLNNVAQKIQQEWNINLEEVPVLSEEDLAQLPGFNEKVVQLKEKIRTFGPVNLLALEDYKKEKERLDFLKKQVEDLVSAKETLNSTVSKINETAKGLFLETFQKVKTNFQSVFGQLFEGGEADLILEEMIDPLESKIEIFARPRGKRLLTLSQLSGGEKALVAIALLFALYLVKPSPFCILDEIDAPLDDMNLRRFLTLVKNFTANTQFIIITHNKLTMDSADILYGVTMEEPGISKIVSVKFEKEPVLA